MLLDRFRRPAPNTTPNPPPEPPPMAPAPAFRFPLVTPYRAVAAAVTLAKHQARRCVWCGHRAHNHGTRYSAMRGHHPFEPSGYRPLPGVRH